MVVKALQSWLGHSARKQRRSPKPGLALEHLEDRATPAAVFWDGGGGSSNWFDALNWSGDALPTLSDDVTISGASGGVEINDTFGTASAKTLTSSSDLRVVSGTLQLDGDALVSGAFALGGVTFGGVVTGTGTLTLSGAVTWGANGVMAGSGTTELTGTSTLEGTTFGSVRENRVVENAGHATLLAANSFTFRDNALFRNLAGGTLEIESGAGIGTFFASSTSKLVNEGAVVVNGPGTTGIGVATENSGTITVNGANLNLTGLTNSGALGVTGGNLNTGSTFANSGTLTVSGGALTTGSGTSSGAIQLAGGASMVVSGTAFTPPFTLQDGATVTGGPIVLNTFEQLAASGTVTVDAVQISGGTLNTLAGSTLTIGTLTQNGTVTGPGTAVVADTWAFTNGSVNGGGRLVTRGTSSISGGFFTTVDTRSIENAGTALLDAGASFTFTNGGTWTNLPGSVFEVRTGASLGTFFTGPTAQFTNQGTILKTGSGAATIALPVVNPSGGTVRVAEGTLNLTGGGSSAGAFDLAPATALRLSGSFALSAGATATGTGQVQFAGGPFGGALTVTGPAALANLSLESGTVTGPGPLSATNLVIQGATVDTTLDVGNLTLASGTLTGAGHVTVGGLFTWTGGTMSGTGTTTLNGTSTIGGSFTLVLDGRTVDNTGTLTWTGNGALQFTNGAVFNNLAGALFDITGDGSIAPSPFGGLVPAFNNAGTLRKSAGSGPVLFGPRTTWSVPLTNSGAIDVRAGNFAVSAPVFGLPAGIPFLTNTGTIQVGTASSSAAAIILPGTAPFPNPPAYTLAAGTLTGTGQVGGATDLTIAPGATLGGTLTVNGNVINRGTVRPGLAPGALTVTGNYTQIADGRLVIGLGGASATGQFGKLQVNGASQLAGALDVFTAGGFLPGFGDVFQVFRTAGTRSGDFTYPVGGYHPGGYRVLVPEYDGTGQALNLVTEVGALPVIDPIADVTVNEGQTVAFTVTATGAEAPGPLTFSLVGDVPVGATIDPSTGAFRFFAPNGPNGYVFRVAISDPSAPGNPVDVKTFTVTALNVAPEVVFIGGQPALNEGDEFNTPGSFTDPGADAWTATVDYGDGTGAQPLALNADKTFALDHRYLDNGTFTVTVRVFDGDEYGTATFNVAVANAAPAAGVSGPATGVRGQARTFVLSATDASSIDAAAGFTFAINWGDGTTQQVTGPSGTTAEHVFTRAGTYTVAVTATDKDGGVSAAVTRTVTVSALAVQDGAFVIGGTTDADTITVSPGAGAGSYIVTMLSPRPSGSELTIATVNPRTNGYDVDLTIGGSHIGVFTITSPEPVSRLEIYAQAGDDTVTVAGGVSLPAIVFGGAGNDWIKAGGGNSVLVGDAGSDTLLGGAGRDVLIGGGGSDQLLGLNGDDILIGGLFLGAEPSQEARRTALLNVATIWGSTASFADRVSALSGYLAPRVDDDGATDYLTGGGGSDWYFARTTGTVSERDVLLGVATQDAVSPV
ncbi:Probable aggregation factor core protein MAFp3, isoform C OS=Cyanothece sp. CCY0110 GN=CY0110_08276 PE=4 SV=1: PKD [Gemmata massiliana]|uniref:PKD domain-containing protein n=1 Tax=Gemmata massiliana TaxID=1210884 RepID=A0A6P2CZ03_9BACT|nr:PKD domain-containing protein [Gemmata massiliana]VTR92440.1 Probable aggregation factor core protein MAFp3, isoform C OS=Cyanothece sp. CCY0110 GN=CY0110_08276 PE=4 SV=1: PKD [Gemmata massiliana]